MSVPVHQAKRPTTALAGPYGHPFHPMLVTLPIGAWVMSFVFDVASHVAGEEEVFAKGAFWLVVAGVVTAPVAALFGLLDLLGIPKGTRAHRSALTHMGLNLAVITLFAVSLSIRRGRLDDPPVGSAPIALSIVALGLLAASGWIGGRLSYRWGVRVADEGTQADGFS